MKIRALIFFVLLACGTTLFGQGTVYFANRATAVGIDAPVFDIDGVTRLAGTNYFAQLYAGADAGNLTPVGAPQPFRTGAAAGYWSTSDATRTLPVNGGDLAYLQAKVWDSTYGATYETAIAAGSKHGESIVIGVITGGAGSPPTLPADMIGLKSFGLIGETRSIMVEPGFSLISNPLFKGNNTVVEVLPNVPEGTILFRWDNRTQVYSINVFDFGRWTNPNQEFPPGTGAFILNPSDLPLQITFTGTAGPGERIAVRAPGYFLIGASDIQSSRVEAYLDFPPAEGDTVYRFVNGKYQLSVYEFNNWQGFQPVIAPGESVFVRLVAP